MKILERFKRPFASTAIALLLMQFLTLGATPTYASGDRGEHKDDRDKTYYTLTYTAGTGGSVTGDLIQTVEEDKDGTEVEAVPDENTCYEFDKWSDDEDDDESYASRQDKDVERNIAVTAEFKLKKNCSSLTTVVSPADGGTVTLPTPNPKIFNTKNEHQHYTAGAVAAVGYSGPVWSSSKTGYDCPSDSFGKGNKVQLVCTATFTKKTYKATFNVDGVLTVVPTLFGSAIALPPTPTKIGYTFGAWSPSVPSTMPAEDLTFVAQWTVNQYDAIFKTDAETFWATVPTNYGSDIVPPADPTKTGWTFTGWEPVPTTMPAEDQTFVAQWKINIYTVTFDSKGGSSVDPLSVEYLGIIGAPTPPPEKTGYTFAGWYYDDGETVSEWIFSENPVTKDITLFSKWNIISYPVTFESNGGTTVEPIDVDYSLTFPAPTAPTKTGNTFGGWYADADLTTPWDFETDVVTEGIVLYAKWTPNVVITFGNVLTPVIAAPVAAAAVAAPAVQGATTVAPAPTTTSEEPAEVKGSQEAGASTKSCPWWWIVALIFAAVLALLGGVIKGSKDSDFVRKYYYVWPPMLAVVAWFAHSWLQDSYSTTWFCNNYWLVVLLIAILGELAYSGLVRSKTEVV